LGVSRSCLTPDTRDLLNRVEAAFGPVQIVSTCRPGAVVAGTGHPSQHRYGRAVDFNAPPGKKAAVVQWLIANNPSGGTMTYASMGHIHMDTGPRHFVSLNSGSGGGHHHAHDVALARHDGTTQRSVAGLGQADTSGAPATGGDWGGSVSSFAPTRSGQSAQPRRYAHQHHVRHTRG
jgi:peptidase M15-like protein